MIEKFTDAAIVKGLLNNTSFSITSPILPETRKIITNVEDFHFEDFDGFVQFLRKSPVRLRYRKRKTAEKLVEESAEEGYELTAQIEALEAQIDAAKKTPWMNNKAIITI